MQTNGKTKVAYASVMAGMGLLAGVLAWLFLLLAKGGFYLLWEKLPAVLQLPSYTTTLAAIVPEGWGFAVYTIILAVVGGLILGLYQLVFGQHPANISDIILSNWEGTLPPFSSLWKLIIGTLLPLIFAGPVGPEAGVVALLAVCYSAARKLNTSRILKGTPQADGNISFAARHSTSALYFLFAVLAYGLLEYLLPKGFDFSQRLAAGSLSVSDALLAVPMIVVGAACGYLYLLAHICFQKLFSNLRTGWKRIISTLLSGLMLGLLGALLPLLLGGGRVQLLTISETYLNFATAIAPVLILLGVCKLLLTALCTNAGWQGGTVMPILFAASSIGLGTAQLFHNSALLNTCIIAGLMLGLIYPKKQWLIAILVFLVFFPFLPVGQSVLLFLFLMAATCLGTLLPQFPGTPGYLADQIKQEKATEQPAAAEQNRPTASPNDPTVSIASDISDREIDALMQEVSVDMADMIAADTGLPVAHCKAVLDLILAGNLEEPQETDQEIQAIAEQTGLNLEETETILTAIYTVMDAAPDPVPADLLAPADDEADDETEEISHAKS